MLGFSLCQAMRRLLAGEEMSWCWSRRAQDGRTRIRQEHAWANGEGATLLSRPPSGAEWWTFAGTKANATLAGELARMCGARVEHDAPSIIVDGAESVPAIEEVVRRLAEADIAAMQPHVEEEALDGLKFSQCLPKELALAMLATRFRDRPAVRAVLSQPLRALRGV